MPVISHRGVRTWPPTWTCTGKGHGKPPHGEAGVLKKVRTSVVGAKEPGAATHDNRIYLFMNYRDSEFVGCLVLDDAAACRQIGTVLSSLRGMTIKQIGDIDLEHLL